MWCVGLRSPDGKYRFRVFDDEDEAVLFFKATSGRPGYVVYLWEM